jgi:hypothetical protein
VKKSFWIAHGKLVGHLYIEGVSDEQKIKLLSSSLSNNFHLNILTISEEATIDATLSPHNRNMGTSIPDATS